MRKRSLPLAAVMAVVLIVCLLIRSAAAEDKAKASVADSSPAAEVKASCAADGTACAKCGQSDKKDQSDAKGQRAAGKPKKSKKSKAKDEAKPDQDASRAKAKKAGEAKKPGEEKPAKESAPKTAVKKATVVRLAITGSLPEGPSSGSLFGSTETGLSKLVRRMDDAAKDKSVAAVLLDIEDLDAGPGKTYELRAAVARLRKAGKPVYAQFASGETREYLLASACDRVAMPPSGMLMIPGVRAEMTFYKGLLEKLGIQVEMFQMGKYKGAGEPFTRNGMSPALHENMESVVDDSYEYLVSTIAENRKLKADRVKELIDQGLFSASAARKAGLIDQVAYADEFEESIRKALKADALNVVRNYHKQDKTEEFSGLSGLVKLMEMAMGRHAREESTAERKIAVIYAVGTIVEGRGSSSLMGEESVGSTSLIEALRTAAEDQKVKAVVLRIDSPGGSAVASDLIWREVERVKEKKPILASMGDVAGSGGYYIAMGATRILAAPQTITGSIGVIGGKPVLTGLLDKIGLTTEVISRGKNSGAFSITQPFTADERAVWHKLMAETYGQFVSKAAEGRKMPRAKLEKLAQGRIYLGRSAVENGLIDGLGTLDDAVAEAKKAAGLKADEKVELMVLPEPKSFFEELFGDPSAMTGDDSIVGRTLRTVSTAGLWGRLFREPSLVLMPCQVELK